jgi:hypothetical protein
MGTAFSNATMYDIWAANWCDRCQRDAIFRNMGKGPGCGILLQVMTTNEVPPEWIVQDGVLGDYHCIEFRGPGWRDPEPKPKPPPSSLQDVLFEVEPHVRMLIQPQPAGEPARTDA